MQATADNAVRAHVFQRDQAIGALAVVEPGTGNVKAIAQSRPMGRNKRAGETYLNYVVPQKFGDSQCCQAGSTFKVFTLAAALEQGIPLNKVFNAPSSMEFEPSDFDSCPGSDQGGPPFNIDNSTSSGRMNLYSGTRLSVNTFYMQLTRETGICKPYEMAKSMGVDLTSPNGDRNGDGAELVPSFTLGVAPVSPLEMAEAYATFAARGLHCHSRPVTDILDSAGNQIRDYAANCAQVMQQSTADAVNDVLTGVINGGFASAQALDQPAAGKTGTTQEGKSVWFVGYTPQLAAAAMIGGANALGVPIGLAGQTIGGSLRPLRVGLRLRGPDLGRRDEALRRLPRVPGVRLPLHRAWRGPDLRRPAAVQAQVRQRQRQRERQRQRQRQRRRRDGDGPRRARSG